MMWTFSFRRIGTEIDKWFRVRVRNLIGVDRPLVGAGDGGVGERVTCRNAQLCAWNVHL